MPEFQDDRQDETPEVEEVVEDGQDDGADDQLEDKTISQKELDRILTKRLKRQEDQLKKQYADFEKYKADAEAYAKLQDEKSTDSQRWEKERERLQNQLKEKEENLTKLQRANIIADLATDKKLPKSFWKRVSGETEEEIAEDIEDMIKDLGIDTGDKPSDDEGSSKKTPAPKKRALYGGGGEQEDPDPDVAEIVARIPRGPQMRIDKPRTFK